MRGLVGFGLGRQRAGGAIPLGVGFHCGVAPRRERDTGRLAPGLERLELGGDARRPRVERLDLLAIEGDLLFLPGDGELAGVRGLARLGRARFCFDQLDTQAAEIGFHFADMSGGDRLALARIRQACACRFDRLGQLPVLARKQHFFPAAQLVAKALVALGLSGLALERAELLVHLEDDVVDARQVQLRGFELQLRGASARLVLGDAGRLFDQLTPIGRTRAQNHPDLALLDDRVGLGAEARVHQQLVNIAQAADLAVDQVFAFTGSVYSRRVTSTSRATDWMILAEAGGIDREQAQGQRPRRDGRCRARCHCYGRFLLRRGHYRCRWSGRWTAARRRAPPETPAR